MHAHRLQLLFAASIAVTLAACSGGTTLTPSSENLQKTPSVSKVKATIHIHIPKRRHHNPRYISTSTKSMAITITPAIGTASKQNANLTPGSPGCVTGTSGTTCTLTIAAKPGNDTGSFTTYDGTLDGSGNPTGKILSANQTASLSVVAGEPNNLNVTLDGVPQYVEVTPGTGASITGTQGSGFSLTKCVTATQPINVVGLDADLNTIIGAGAPVSSLTSDDPTHIVIATPAPGASPNVFNLTHPISSSNQSATLTATVTPPNASGATPVTLPVSMTVHGGAAICGVFTEYPIPTASSRPIAITQGPDGAMWFTESGGNKIGRVTTEGVMTEYTGLTSASSPEYIVSGPAYQAALWFTEKHASKIGTITLAGAVTEYTTTTSNSQPIGIASGPDNALWFTETVPSKIGRITTMGTVTAEYTAGLTPSSFPFGIAAGADGNLWFTEIVAAQIGKITTTGSITEYTLTGNSIPVDIAAGPDQALWFADCGTNQIGRITTAGAVTEYTVPTPMSSPESIVAGPSGELWFTECGANKIGSVTTSGVFTEYSIPTAQSEPVSLAVGSDGGLWFTELSGKIGRLQ